MKKLNSTTFLQRVKDDPADQIEVEVGDSKQPDFKPQFKLMRWENEVNFSLRAREHAQGVLETDGEMVKYVTPDYEVHQYDKPEAGEDGGFEFEWVLPSKPDSNVLEATIQTKGLDFFYQPALTPEEIAEGANRPENVVGSYAVYHKTKKNNRVGGKHYKTGKAFHIYRPKAVDANGVEVWCDLLIKDDLLTVTVPQDFLDSAVYPVKVDPTFGYTSIGGSTLTSFYDGHTGVCVFSMPEDGTVTSVSAYMDGTSGAKITAVIYSTQAAGYGRINDNSSEATVDNSSASWQTASWASGNPVLTSGVSYNIGMGADSTNNGVAYYDAGAVDQGAIDTSAYPPVDPFVEAFDYNNQFSIYATYTASGGSSTIKTVNGVAIASVKTVNGVAIASVKSINGVE